MNKIIILKLNNLFKYKIYKIIIFLNNLKTGNPKLVKLDSEVSAGFDAS